MIDKQTITDIIAPALEGTDCFLVDVTVSAANDIVVEIDSNTTVDIDTCARLTRLVEQTLDRDTEDYSLEVGSAGLTAPLRVRRQFEKNIGNEVEALTLDGRKLSGILSAVSADGSEVILTVVRKVKEPGAKRPVMVEEPLTLPVADTKYIRYKINFK